MHLQLYTHNFLRPLLRCKLNLIFKPVFHHRFKFNDNFILLNIMIDVKAEFKSRSVYFAGETLECQITFKNIGNPQASPSKSPKKLSPSKSSQGEVIAWASAQIHCFLHVSESRVALPPSMTRQKPVTSTDDTKDVGGVTGQPTCFIPYKNEHGHCVLQTPVKILFCDLKLASGECKIYTFNEVIPSDCPPSYRGASVKYSFKITIGTQRVGAPIKLLRVPFRVMVVYGLTEFRVAEDYEVQANPFIENTKPRADLLDIASEVLSMITTKRSTHKYKIANSKGFIGVFNLIKTSCKLGDDIIGLFDFSDGVIPCIQFTVYLQSEEILSEECQRKPNQENYVSSCPKQMQFCLYVKQCHISVPVPLHTTPGFLTELVSLRWRLHFDFVVGVSQLKGTELETTQPGDRMWQGPNKIETETMSWNLPVRILPTMPIHIQSPSTTTESFRLVF